MRKSKEFLKKLKQEKETWQNALDQRFGGNSNIPVSDPVYRSLTNAAAQYSAAKHIYDLMSEEVGTSPKEEEPKDSVPDLETVGIAIKMLEYELASKTDPIHFAFMLKARSEGHLSDEEVIEMRGYYKGISTAKQIIERQIATLCELDGWVPEGTLCEECQSEHCPLSRKYREIEEAESDSEDEEQDGFDA